MNIQSNAVPERAGSEPIAPAVISRFYPLYWSIRRELWENRSVYLAPLAAGALFLLSFVVQMIVVRVRAHGAWKGELFNPPYQLAAFLIMGTAFIVGIFYSLDALYAERRDRSILFWKSLPVSDLTTVLSKLAIPLAFLPLLSFAITIVTQWLMLLLNTVVLLGSGLNMSPLWSHLSFAKFSLVLLYHIVTVHGLWYAPLYGWLLLVSAWSRRAPVIWAFLPPFLIWGIEKLAFNTTHFLALLENRLMGPQNPAAAQATDVMDVMASMTPGQFFSMPGLWIGLAIAVVLLAGAVRLRRYRGPI